METRYQYVIVGLFVMLLGAAAVGISLWLAFGDISQEYRTYRVYMTESVSGLYIDAPVSYRGVVVGKVRGIRLDPDDPQRVELTIDLKPETPVSRDTVATLRVQGLTGIASIELSGGGPESPRLEAQPGEEYPVIRAGPSLFKRLDTAVSELLLNLNNVSKDFHALMSPQNRVNLSKILAHLEVLTEGLSQQRDEIAQGLGHAARAFEALADASETLKPLLAQVDSSAAAVEIMAEDFAEASRTLRDELKGSRAELRQAGSGLMPEIERLMQKLQSLSLSLERVAERIEENPSVLIYGPRSDPPGPGE